MSNLRTFSIAASLAVLVLMLLASSGCNQQSTPKLTSEQLKAFDSAPADMKQTWNKALAADKANDYVNAQNLLDSLNQTNLSELQRSALEIETSTFQARLWQAAEKNDPAAVKAVQEINQARRTRR